MVEHPGVAALTQIMSPDHGADEQVDWAVAETTWNVRFPTDYKAFMSVYGGGSINGEAGVLLPSLRKASNGIPATWQGRPRTPAMAGRWRAAGLLSTSTRRTSLPGASRLDRTSSAG